MSNDIRTRRLIVTMPDMSGEEADIAASTIERRAIHHGGTGSTVVHALDAAPLEGSTVRASRDGGVLVALPFKVSPADARKAAALLLRAADEAEVEAPAEVQLSPQAPAYGVQDTSLLPTYTRTIVDTLRARGLRADVLPLLDDDLEPTSGRQIVVEVGEAGDVVQITDDAERGLPDDFGVHAFRVGGSDVFGETVLMRRAGDAEPVPSAVGVADAVAACVTGVPA